MSSLTQAYRLQTTIVHAFVMRNLRSSYSMSRLGIVLHVIEPSVMVIAIFLMRWLIAGKTEVKGVPLAVFVTTGYMPYYFHRMTLGDVASVTYKKTSSLMFPSVTPLDNVMARAVNTYLVYGMAMAMIFALVINLFNSHIPDNLLQAFYAIALIMWYTVALGVLFGVIVRVIPIFQLFIGPFGRASLLISGGLYLAEEMPPRALMYASWNPLFVGIEMVREAFIRGYVSPIASVPYLLNVCLVLSVLSLALERRTRNFRLS